MITLLLQEQDRNKSLIFQFGVAVESNMWSSLIWLELHVFIHVSLPFANPYINMGPIINATVTVIQLALWLDKAAVCRPQFAFTWRGMQYTWNHLPQGCKHSLTICHGLIQAALEKGEAPEHLQYIDDIIVWGNMAVEVFEKGERIIQILLRAGFAIKKSKVKGPAQEIQFLGVKWQDGWHQISTEVINKITVMSPPTDKKETQAFLGVISFWSMHIPEYSQIVSPLYLVTCKKNDFH
ncbi:hypothetical protein TURU_031956 [Turdus rufiventris]|nr:hypothetical protein TURU_031956 [Turdus rufiventris]